MTELNRTTLFAAIRNGVFKGKLKQTQVDGIEAILAAWDKAGGKDMRHLAYILATAYHETGKTMQPVRECYGKTDAESRKKLAGKAYAKSDAVTGHAYYGRGFVQLTWATNYKTMGRVLSLPLYEKPDLALNITVAAEILVVGMMQGLFTGKRLVDYFDGVEDDAVRARRIVNASDKAALIASYHKDFLAALKDAETSTPQPANVNPKDAVPDADVNGKVITAITGSGLAGSAALFAALDSWQAFAGFALVIVIFTIGAWAYYTGRIKRRV